MIEQNNAMHNNEYTNANYQPASPSAIVRSGGSRGLRYSGSKKRLEVMYTTRTERISDEGSIRCISQSVLWSKLMVTTFLMSDGMHGTGESKTKSKEVEADLKRIVVREGQEMEMRQMVMGRRPMPTKMLTDVIQSLKMIPSMSSITK